MRFSKLAVLAAIAAPTSAFVTTTPLGEGASGGCRQRNQPAASPFTTTTRTGPLFADEITEVVNMAAASVGPGLVSSNAALYIAPLAAIAAGVAALSQKSSLESDVAATEEELNSIKEKLKSTQSQITVSFFSRASLHVYMWCGFYPSSFHCNLMFVLFIVPS
jgi:hypothetical protein